MLCSLVLLATMARPEGGIKSKLYSFNINRNWYCTVSPSLYVCVCVSFELSPTLELNFRRIFSRFFRFFFFFVVVIEKQIIVILHHINSFCTHTHTLCSFFLFPMKKQFLFYFILLHLNGISIPFANAKGKDNGKNNKRLLETAYVTINKKRRRNQRQKLTAHNNGT